MKALVITGEGKSFVAGADIKEMVGFTPGEAKRFSKLFHRVMDFVETFPVPVIGAVNGFALGGGCELVLACDLVVASSSAIFGQPEINLGIIPGAGGTQRLPERVGRLKAKELIFTGRKVNANEALSLGLVNKVVPKARLLEEAMALALVITSKPKHCLEAIKHLVDSGSPGKEIDAFGESFSHEDRNVLMERFLKRK